MRETKFTVRDKNGRLLDQATIINAPDLADKRIANATKHYPDAVVDRVDRDVDR